MRTSRIFTPLAVALALLIPLVAGCGGDDAPSRNEFIGNVKEAVSKDFSSALTGTGIDAKAADALLTDFAGCVYDKVEGDTEELKAISTGSGDEALNKALDGKAAVCTAAFTKALTTAAGQSTAGSTDSVEPPTSGADG